MGRLHRIPVCRFACPVDCDTQPCISGSRPKFRAEAGPAAVPNEADHVLAKEWDALIGLQESGQRYARG